MTETSTLTPKDIITSNWELIGGLDVAPHPAPDSRSTFVVGEYESTMPEPVLLLSVEPGPELDPDAFVAELKRIDEGDTYRMVYFFGNFGGPRYRVKVWEKVS